MKPRQGSLNKNFKDSPGVEKDSCDGTSTNQKLEEQAEGRTHQ